MRCTILALVVSALAQGCAIQAPPGNAGEPERRMVDVGGRSLSLRCVGAGDGPVVFLEGGAAASSVLYWQVQDRIAGFARVCTYDRAGLGWSTAAQPGRDFQAMADDLQVLLERSGVRGPYVLAGHSMGGFIVRLAAARRPADIAGVLLIDASEEGFSFSPDGAAGNEQTAAQLDRLAGAAAAGLATVVETALPIPAGAPAEAAVIRNPHVIRTGADELRAFGLTTDAERAPGGLGGLDDIPLIVLSRGRMADPPSARDLAWREGQLRLMQLSRNSEHRIAEESGHNIHTEQPDAIVDALQRLLAMIGAE